MSDLASALPFTPSSSVVPDASGEQATLSKKKKGKVRSAWISFIGRILAQMFGAVATVMLGLQVMQSYLPMPQAPPTHAATVDQPATPVRQRPAGVVGLAVLRFANYSDDSRQQAFSDGLTEALTAEFAQVPGLQVTSRTSSMHIGAQGGLIPAIARQLGVDLVLEGSVVREGSRVRVTAQLIDAERDAHLWTRVYERHERDVLSLHTVLAAAIVRDVRAEVLTELAGRPHQ